MNPQAFQRAMGRAPQRVPFAKMIVPPSPKPLPAEALAHFWYPEREGVEQAPERIRKQLAKIHPDLAMVRPPANAPTPSHAWICWFRKAEVTYWLSPGWFLFFIWQERNETYDMDGDGVKTAFKPLSLDDPRLIANIYRFSVFGEFKSAEAHFKNIQSQLIAEKQAQQQADKKRRDDIGHDFFNYRKIKNIGHGSKFATHHDGTIVPSRGQDNRTADRGSRDDPSWVTEQAKRDKERRRDRRGR